MIVRVNVAGSRAEVEDALRALTTANPTAYHAAVFLPKGWDDGDGDRIEVRAEVEVGIADRWDAIDAVRKVARGDIVTGGDLDLVRFGEVPEPAGRRSPLDG